MKNEEPKAKIQKYLKSKKGFLYSGVYSPWLASNF